MSCLWSTNGLTTLIEERASYLYELNVPLRERIHHKPEWGPMLSELGTKPFIDVYPFFYEDAALNEMITTYKRCKRRPLEVGRRLRTWFGRAS